jgi:hypothetical protein
MSQNKPLKPFGPGSLVAAHWHGKPMHMLRFATIVANMPRGRK